MVMLPSSNSKILGRVRRIGNETFERFVKTREGAPEQRVARRVVTGVSGYENEMVDPDRRGEK